MGGGNLAFQVHQVCLASLIWLAGLIAAFVPGAIARGDEPAAEVFSGPQVDEPLPAFKVKGVLGPGAGEELDLVARAAEKPLVLLFVHEVTRPSVGLSRVLAEYSAKLEGTTCGVVFLDADPTKVEQWMKNAQHALPTGVAVGYSTDGVEGPGALGLNRNVQMTVLVGKAGRVTANFALVQPSLQADAPRIATAIAKTVGVEPPTPESLGASGRPGERATVDLRSLLQPVIRKDASAESVREAAAVVERRAAAEPAVRAEVGRVARTIVEAGKVGNYGTEVAQEFLRKWAREFNAPPPTGATPDKAPSSDNPPRRNAQPR